MKKEKHSERIPAPLYGRAERERENGKMAEEAYGIHVFNFIGIFGSFTYQQTNKNENHWHSVAVAIGIAIALASGSEIYMILITRSCSSS